MAVEGVGFGLAILAEVWTTTKSVIRTERYNSYKSIPVLYGKVHSSLTRACDLARSISGIFKNNLGTLPDDMVRPFVSSLNAVKDDLKSIDERLKELPAPGVVHRSFVGDFKEFSQAKSKAKELKDMEQEVRDMESKL